MNELRRFFQFLDQLLTQVDSERRGRPPVSKIHFPHSHAKLVKLLLLAAAFNWNDTTLFQKLRALRNTTYRWLLGIRLSEVPHRTTLGRRKRSLPFLRYLARLLRRLAKAAICRAPGDLRVIVLDLTDLPTDPDWDLDGRWGRVKEDESFYGWKLHLIVNRRGLIIGATLTTADKRETVRITTLLVDLWRLIPVKWRSELIQQVIGDEGYDGEEVHRLIHDLLNAEAVIPLNPRGTEPGTEPQGSHRKRTGRYLQTPEGKAAWKKRTVIERTNRTVKIDLGLEERLGVKEPWTAIKISVVVWLSLIRYDVGRLLGQRSRSYSEGVKALVM